METLNNFEKNPEKEKTSVDDLIKIGTNLLEKDLSSLEEFYYQDLYNVTANTLSFANSVGTEFKKEYFGEKPEKERELLRSNINLQHQKEEIKNIESLLVDCEEGREKSKYLLSVLASRLCREYQEIKNKMIGASNEDKKNLLLDKEKISKIIREILPTIFNKQEEENIKNEMKDYVEVYFTPINITDDDFIKELIKKEFSKDWGCLTERKKGEYDDKEDFQEKQIARIRAMFSNVGINLLSDNEMLTLLSIAHIDRISIKVHRVKILVVIEDGRTFEWGGKELQEEWKKIEKQIPEKKEYAKKEKDKEQKEELENDFLISKIYGKNRSLEGLAIMKEKREEIILKENVSGEVLKKLNKMGVDAHSLFENFLDLFFREKSRGSKLTENIEEDIDVIYRLLPQKVKNKKTLSDIKLIYNNRNKIKNFYAKIFKERMEKQETMIIKFIGELIYKILK